MLLIKPKTRVIIVLACGLVSNLSDQAGLVQLARRAREVSFQLPHRVRVRERRGRGRNIIFLYSLMIILANALLNNNNLMVTC